MCHQIVNMVFDSQKLSQKWYHEIMKDLIEIFLVLILAVIFYKLIKPRLESKNKRDEGRSQKTSRNLMIILLVSTRNLRIWNPKKSNLKRIPEFYLALQA